MWIPQTKRRKSLKYLINRNLTADLNERKITTIILNTPQHLTVTHQKSIAH